MIDVAGNVGAFSIEQTVVRGAAQIKFAASRQHRRQMFAIAAIHEFHPLYENIADDLIEILCGLPVDPKNQHDAPHQKEHAVNDDQPRRARPPADIERLRRRWFWRAFDHKCASILLESIMYPQPRTVRMSDALSPTSTLRRKRAMCTSITLV